MRVYIEIEPVGLSNVVPAAVMNVQAQDMGTVIQVSWDEFEVVNEERDGVVVKYVVEKKVNDGNWSHMFDFTDEDWATGFFFYDIEREEGNTYSYRIKAVTSLNKETDWSKVATIEIEEETPATVPGIVSHPANPETSFNYIKFNWSVPDDGGSAITGYAIRRDGVIIENNWPTNEYIDLDAPNGNLIYNFAAINSVGQGGWSADKATQLRGWSQNTLVISSSRIDITINGPWQSMSTPHSWDIQRSIDNSNWVTIATDQTGIYEDKGLTPDTLYFYRTVMKNEYGISPPSAVSSVRTLEEDEPSEVFNAPLLSAEIDIDNQNGIYTTWTPNPENTVAADYYEFEKIEEDGSPSISGAFSGAGGTAKDSVVTAGKVYKYRCRGHHSVHGYTPWSDQVTINLIYLNREYDYTYPSPAQGVALGAAYVYFPPEYRKNPTSDFPVFVYAHGMGERAGGTSPNFSKLAEGAGPTKELRGKTTDIPVIAICPQVVGWGSFATEGMIDECIDAVINGLTLPLSGKFVLSGYSSGGNDTWPYVRNASNTNVVGFIPFACRLGIPSGNAQVQAYLDRNIPTWIFHNIDDPSQTSSNHIGFLNTVKSIDPDNDFIRGTIYQGGGHDPVTRTINGSGGAVVAGWHPYLDAGTALYDWIEDVYFGNTPDPGPEPEPEEGLQREYDFTYTSEVQGVTGAAYVYIPQAYRDNPVSDFPVMVYCHGQGQRAGGTSPNFNALVSDDGYARWLRGTTNELPYIVISPQVVGWQSFALEGMIDEAFDKVRAELLPDLNPNKYVLSGWSAGGNDTWPFVRNTSTRVVGFISFGCRLNIPTSNAQVQAYLDREIPTWVFHNNDDEIQDVSNHKAFLAEVNNIDPDIEYIRGTIYDAAGHPVVEKTISGIGDDVISGYYPYKNAGDELAEWIENAYFGTMQPSRFINIGCTTQFRESIEVEGWNKFALFLPTDPAKALLDSEGQATGYTMKITAPFTSDSNSNISTGDDSGPVPDEIMAGFWYRSNGIATIEFVLDKTKKYKFTFYGGRDGSADDKSADFTIGSETVSLNGLHNLYNTVSINNVVPDNDNIVVLSVKNTPGYVHAILNAIMIEEY